MTWEKYVDYPKDYLIILIKKIHCYNVGKFIAGIYFGVFIYFIVVFFFAVSNFLSKIVGRSFEIKRFLMKNAF